MLGSVFAFYGIVRHDNILLIIFSLISFLVCLAVLIFFAVRNKNIKFVLVPIIAFFVGVGSFFIAKTSFEVKNLEQPTIVTARIYSVKIFNNCYKVEVDNLYFDGIKMSGKAEMYVYDYSYQFSGIEVGANIKFKPTSISATKLCDGEIPSAAYYNRNVKYRINANISSFTFGETKLTFAEKIKVKIKQVLMFGFSNENAELMYSGMFGDKAELNETYKNSFQLSGVAHLLAVSGLHVGIIVGILSLFCKLCHIKNWYKVVLIGSVLLFYMYICNFATSVIRASIMSLVLLMAPLFRRKYDTLSAIGLAGIICFIIDPFMPFDIAAMMSFSCVVGICLFSPSISKVLARTKMPKYINQSLSISLSTTIYLMFIMAYFFNNMNLISIIANVLLIPLFTIAFSASFVVGFLGIIFPPLGYILYPLNYLIDFIALVSNVLGNLPFANIVTTKIQWIIIVIYLTMLVMMSRITTAKPTHKIVVVLTFVAILLAIML